MGGKAASAVVVGQCSVEQGLGVGKGHRGGLDVCGLLPERVGGGKDRGRKLRSFIKGKFTGGHEESIGRPDEIESPEAFCGKRDGGGVGFDGPFAGSEGGVPRAG